MSYRITLHIDKINLKINFSYVCCTKKYSYEKKH